MYGNKKGELIFRARVGACARVACVRGCCVRFIVFVATSFVCSFSNLYVYEYAEVCGERLRS